ncbi:lengsin [Podarcis raffonei]|uniref:lengsin n=1 Tax=Podarcis raffonei TaxID=65483 RepID=UPI0023299F13|nr:lengsin [Podarcis raffonei]
MDKEDANGQSTAGNETEEVDGNCMCGLRRKRGVKVTGEQNLTAGCETVDTSHPGNTSDSLSHQRKLAHLKPCTDELLQKPPGFPAMQEADESPPKYCHTTEDPQQGREEPHKSSPEAHGAIENFSNEDHALKTDLDGKEEKVVCLNTVKIRENAKTPGNDKEKPDTAEKEWKFHMTEKKDMDHHPATQEKDESKVSLALGSGISKETLQELKNLLRESPVLSTRVRNSGKPRSPSSHTLPLKSSDNQRSYMEMFHPHLRGGDQKVLSGRKPGAGLAGKPPLLHSSAGLDKQPSESEDMDHSPGRQQTHSPNVGSASEAKFEPTSEHSRDPSVKSIPLHLVSEIERIKEQMSRDNIRFVRFEAADLHGVSRSKSIPSRFFRTKAIHGVAMPRGYLELTLNPKDNEINHISASNFNCDIILSPELSTFRVLPWTEDTARVICDSFAVTGNPLLTSPRHIAKQQLGQLQDHGFALRSAFTYEFCIYGIAEIINSKTITFPATTMLNNQDQCFIQELIDGMYHAGANIESFSSSTGPGQMEISFQPEFGLSAADSAFTFRTGIKEVAKKYNYIASFFTENGFCNSGILSHSLWDITGENNLFSSGSGAPEFTDIGKNWLAGLLVHSAALSCLMAPTIGCRKRYNVYRKDSKEMVSVKWAWNDNSCAFNVKSHGEKGTRIESRLGSAMANPYLVLSATIAAGLDGIRRGLSFQEASEEIQSTAQFKVATIPLKLEDALIALQEDECIREALGNTFVRYFVAMKQYEMENEEMDVERNKFLEYFI